MPADMPADTGETPEPAEVSPEVSDTGAATGAVGGPTLTLTEAVKHTGRSRATLQRRLKAGAIPGAERTSTGGWSIPIAGLIAAGLAPATTPAEHPDPVPPAAGSDAELEQLRSEVVRLRAERDHGRELAEVYREQAEALQRTLEVLAHAIPPAPGSPAGQRRRWWRK